MRHDVELGMERAYRLALLENENNFVSTYFFQLTNNSYNVLAQKNLDMIKEIYNLGHMVGFHFHLNGMKDTEEIKKAIKTEIRYQWNYGLYPDRKTINDYKKVQILTHPYSWSEKGYDNLNNFRTLYKEKCKELLSTFDSECKHFAEIKYEL